MVSRLQFSSDCRKNLEINSSKNVELYQATISNLEASNRELISENDQLYSKQSAQEAMHKMTVKDLNFMKRMEETRSSIEGYLLAVSNKVEISQKELLNEFESIHSSFSSKLLDSISNNQKLLLKNSMKNGELEYIQNLILGMKDMYLSKSKIKH